MLAQTREASVATTQLPNHRENLAVARQDAVTAVGIPTPTVTAHRGRTTGEWPRIRGYDVLSVIGTGGMANVYQARHRDLRRIVAIKTIRASVLTDPEFLERFYAEAEAVARLQHPNIIQVFEIGTVETQIGEPIASPFIALEFVEGGCLSSRTGSPQPPRESAELVEKLARAAHAAHRLGVIHRDLKPSNVLLTREGEPKIADFGVAKQLFAERDKVGRYVTQAGTVMGTPEYMAPEQASSAPPTPAVDIYALGVILYEMLTSRVPFTAATPLETIDLVRTQEPVSPRQLQPRLPRDLETICLKCLQKDPARRYQTAEALADDLRRFLDHRPIQARRVSQLEKVSRCAKRNPLPAISLTAVVAIFVAAFALVTSSYISSEKARQEESRQREEALRREKAERWNRYLADIKAAAHAMQVYNVEGAARTLESSPEEHRNWEWQYLTSRRDLAQSVLNVIEGDTGGAQISADGRRVLLGSDQGIKVWDIVEKRELVALDRSKLAIGHAHLSADGTTLAYILDHHKVIVRDVESNRIRTELHGQNERVLILGFTPSGKQIITKTDKGPLQLWDAKSGKAIPVACSNLQAPHNLSFDAEATLMTNSVVGEKWVHVLRCESGREIATIPIDGRHVQSVELTWSGDWIIIRELYPRSVVRILDTNTGGEIYEMAGHKNSVIEMALSPDKTRMATASRDQSIGLWDISKKQKIAMLHGHLGCVQHVAFSPDGNRLISSSEDHTVRIWDAHTGESLAVLTGHTNDVLRASYTADGKTIVSASRDGSIRLWDAHLAETNNILRGHQSFIYSAAFHPDGEHVASASWDGTARIWEASTGRTKAILHHGNDRDGKIVTSVAFHPDGKILATRARGGVRLWDVQSGAEIHRWDVANDGFHDTRLAFSRKGDLLAAGCFGRVIRIWDVETRRERFVLEGHEQEVSDVAFSPDGCWLVSTGDRAARVWDLSTGKLFRELNGHQLSGLALAFNLDGTRLATSSNDNTVRLWDVTTWTELEAMNIGTKVYGLAFSADGTRLAGACADNSIRFWDLTMHQEVADLRGHGAYVHQIAFSKDGTRLVSASGDHTLRIWDTLSVQQRSKR